MIAGARSWASDSETSGRFHKTLNESLSNLCQIQSMGENATHSQVGFTLIELSIVLVIIGLIVGGILVGRDLISAAAVRAQISQIEKFNTAVNTFFGKFQAVPGDMDPATAASFGLPVHLAPGTTAVISNDGLLEGTDSGSGDIYGQGSYETGQFWLDLSSNAGGHLIEGNFSGVNAGCASDIWAQNAATCFPAAKLGTASNYISILTENNANYFELGAISPTDPGNNLPANNPGVTVSQAYSIDQKMDDGFPTTGNVGYNLGQVITRNDPGSALSCSDNRNTGNTPLQYSTEINNGAGVNCSLIFKIQGGD